MQKILYVEDDLSLIDGLQYTLESSGYAVDNYAGHWYGSKSALQDDCGGSLYLCDTWLYCRMRPGAAAEQADVPVFDCR